jgi:hypothetical protein
VVSGAQVKAYLRSASFWTALGTLASVLGVVVAALAWWYPAQPEVSVQSTATATVAPGIPTSDAADGPWPGDPQGVIWVTGSESLASGSAVDLDTGTVARLSTFYTPEYRGIWPDIVFRSYGIEAVNGAGVVVVSTSVPIRLATEEQARVCVRTSDGRYGFVHFEFLEYSVGLESDYVAGQPSPDYDVAFTTWMKSGDKASSEPSPR